MNDDGFVRVYRRVLDNPEFRDQSEAMVFVWMVMRASWQPTRVRYKDRTIQLERGQLALSVRDLASAFGRSKDWANRFLDRLANRDMIATATATGVNIITLCKYAEYQASKANGATVHDQQPRQDRDRTATQNKEDKEINEGIISVSKDTSPALKPEHVIEFWNEQAGKLGLSKASLTAKRRTALAQRIRVHGVDDWTEAIAALARSPFCLGENDRDWKANIDWMLRPDTITKLKEGIYDGKRH